MRKNKKLCTHCGTTEYSRFIKSDVGILCYRHYDQYKKGKLGATRERIFHGMTKTPEHNSWLAMINRSGSYAGYEDIVICNRWQGKLGFINFLEDMGKKPFPESSIDRIENDKGYYKENCRWTNRRTQQINRTLQTNNTSGYKGIYWHKKNETWITTVKILGKIINLGSYKNKQYAIEARKEGELLFYEGLDTYLL